MLPTLAQSFYITVVDLAPLQLELEADERIRYVHGDLHNSETLTPFLSSDVVGIVHLGTSSHTDCEDDACWEVKSGATRSILEAMRTTNSGAWLLHASSQSMDMSSGDETGEGHGVSRTSEEEIMEASRESSLRAIVLRLSNIYGGDITEPDLVANLVRSALSDQSLQITNGHGERIMDLLHIDDCVEGIWSAIAKLESMRKQTFSFWRSESYFEHFDIMSGEITTESDLVDKVIQYSSSSSPVQRVAIDASSPHVVGSIGKASNILGFRAQVSLDDGLQRTIGQYRKAFLEYADEFVSTHCQAPSVEDRINEQLELLDQCDVHLAVDIGGTLYQMQRKGAEISADGQLGQWAWDATNIRFEYRGDHVTFSPGGGLYVNETELWIRQSGGNEFRMEVRCRP